VAYFAHFVPATSATTPAAQWVDVEIVTRVWVTLRAMRLFGIGFSYVLPSSAPATVFSVRNWFKMIRIGTDTIATQMVKFKPTWDCAEKFFPQVFVPRKISFCLCRPKVTVTHAVWLFRPIPTAILCNRQSPEFLPIRESIMAYSLHEQWAAIAPKARSMRRAVAKFSSWFRAIFNSTRVCILVRHRTSLRCQAGDRSSGAPAQSCYSESSKMEGKCPSSI